MLLAAIFAVSGINRIMAYNRYKSLEFQSRVLQLQIQFADNLEDNHEALIYYKNMDSPFPEIQLRILQRQWLVALEMVSQIQSVRHHAVLKDDVPAMFNKLKDHLHEMGEGCDAQTIEVSENSDILWRIYNIRGAARLLTAFVISEREKNLKKVRGMMKSAISDFKLAIESVDQSDRTDFEKHIPRWNLEILHGEQFVRNIAFTETDAEQRLKLKDNLEAIIPEKGGYAPGEPLETRIRK